MLQGVVGQVRLVTRAGRDAVEKRMADPTRHSTEVLALRALAAGPLPVPELIEVEPGSIVMTLMPGERIDRASPDVQLDGLRTSVALLQQLHRLQPPRDLPPAPDDALIVRRYREAGGPPLPLSTPPIGASVFCHGDWTGGNLLIVDGTITGVIDWEAAHLGDAIREVSRAAWGASLNDPRAFDVIVDAYGADPAAARAWTPIHAAEPWLWLREAGPPEYLQRLTADLENWPAG